MSKPLNIRPLTPELQKRAIEEINERPERLAADVEALRTWIDQQPHLKARTDDQFLVGFLRGCKHSLERAKSKIDKFYTLRTKYPDVFRCADTDTCLSLWKLGIFYYMPRPLNDNGPRIGVFRMGAYDPDKLSFFDVMHFGQALQEMTIREDDYAMINGVIHIMDLSDVKPQHFVQWTPSLSKKMTVWNEEAMPLRPKANHFINAPAMFEPIFNMFKPMLPKKQQQRLFVHGKNYESMYKQLPKEYLPKEYGGLNGSFLDNDVPDLIESYRDYFKDGDNYGTDENLRVGKPIDFENLFGIEGSFRKLDVD